MIEVVIVQAIPVTAPRKLVARSPLEVNADEPRLQVDQIGDVGLAEPVQVVNLRGHTAKELHECSGGKVD